jgi:3-phenylpropionate/trans-cinnamate dioxygenase ferredoxin reductase component
MSEVRTVAIVGASAAGGTAAATLRDEGFEGRIVLIGAEPHPPYERPPLSKEVLRGQRGALDALIRPDDWWREHEVETRFGRKAHRCEPIERSITLDDGERISFDRAVIATGVRNRRLDVPGIDLPGIYELRTAEHAERIRTAADGASHVVIVGFGFIGAEVAASLRRRGLAVTVVEIFQTALYRILGADIGRAIEEMHRDNGVIMHFDDTVERFEGDGRVQRLLTRSGRTIECDFVVVGVGTEPVAEVMHGVGIGSNGGIKVDAYLETEVPGVFAVGDVAIHDHPVFGRTRVEHFDNAMKMGATAARNILGRDEVFDDPHWFWSDQYDSNLQMSGVAPTWDRMVVRGSLEERKFCAFLLDAGGVLRSAVSLDWSLDVRRSFSLIKAQVVPDPSALADPDVDLRKLIPSPA